MKAALVASIVVSCIVIGIYVERVFSPAKTWREHVVIADCAPGADVMMEDAQGMGPPMFWCEAVERDGRTIHEARRFPEDVRPMRLSFPGRKRMRIVVEEADR